MTEGTLFVQAAGQSSPAPLLHTDVAIRVTGVVARAVVRQQFTNPGQEWAEGVYVFPLPEDAAVDHLRMRVGDRVVEGRISERAAARATYEQARTEGKRASLVEQERPNVFTTSVASIAPGALIDVEIEYQQTLRWDAGTLRLRFPMVVSPRYVPGAALPVTTASGTGRTPDTDLVPDASRITPPVAHPAGGPVNPVSLVVELDAGVPLAGIGSSYHPVEATPLADGRYRVALLPGVAADRDFELKWQPLAAAQPTATVFAERKDGDVYALLVVLPPAAPAGARPPREIVFVLDTSGSMAGASIEQAKGALRLALARLAPADTFNVIEFSSRARALFAAPQPAAIAATGRADEWVAGLRASGGTEMRAALELALDAHEDPTRLRQVVFLTDGAVGNEDELFQVIRARLGDRRLFTVGIGAAPNSHFMREAARAGRGTFTYVGSPTEVKEKMTTLFARLESPALTDLRVEGLERGELVPARIPDLYTGEPLVVAVKTPALPPRVLVRGNLGASAWTQEVALHDAAAGAGVPQHWARGRIAELVDGAGPRVADDVRLAVTRLALEHHLVSKFTSLVAVDVTPVRPGGDTLGTHAMPTALPDGWDLAAMGQGATAGSLQLIVGLLLCALAASACAVARRAA